MERYVGDYNTTLARPLITFLGGVGRDAAMAMHPVLPMSPNSWAQ